MNGTGVNFGYEQIVPTVTSFGTAATRHASTSWIPMIAFS